MKWNEYPDRDFLALDLAEVLADALNRTLHHKERATFAVPGGTSPGPVFDALSQVHLDWHRIDVLLTDERWVPESSDRSNTGLLRRTLLKGQAAAANLVPMVADTAEPEDALDALAAMIAPLLPIDVMLIGMGADMHTASLFPGADRLADALSPKAPVLMPMRAPGAPEPRVTLTAPVLRGAVDTHVLIYGKDKKAAITAAAGLDPIDAPVATILGTAEIHYAD